MGIVSQRCGVEMVPITNNMLASIQKYVKRENISYKEFAKRVEVLQPVVSIWLSGKLKTIKRDTFERVRELTQCDFEKDDIEKQSDAPSRIIRDFMMPVPDTLSSSLRNYAKSERVSFLSIAKKLQISASTLSLLNTGSLSKIRKDLFDKMIEMMNSRFDPGQVPIPPKEESNKENSTMDYEKYKNKMPYPPRPVKPFMSQVKATAEDYRKHADALEEYEKKEIEFKEAKVKYSKEDGRLYDLFREDAIEDVGLKGHPKAEKAFSLAWQKGHSSGNSAVVSELEELADLLLND